MSDQEILTEVIGCRGEELDKEEDIDDNDDSEPILKQGIEEARKTMGILEEFSLFARFGEDMMKSLKEINRGIDKEVQCCKKTRYYH